MDNLELKQSILDCVEAIIEDAYEVKFMMKGIQMVHEHEGPIAELGDYIEGKLDDYREQLINIQELLDNEDQPDAS